MSADPFFPCIAGLARDAFDTVMSKADSDAFGGEFANFFDVSGFGDGMPGTAIHVKENGIDAVERGFVSGPAAFLDGRFDAGGLIQALCEQHATGVEFMIARAVAGPTGDEENFFLGGGGL
jgi:hypothetical protein